METPYSAHGVPLRANVTFKAAETLHVDHIVHPFGFIQFQLSLITHIVNGNKPWLGRTTSHPRLSSFSTNPSFMDELKHISAFPSKPNRGFASILSFSTSMLSALVKSSDCEHAGLVDLGSFPTPLRTASQLLGSPHIIRTSEFAIRLTMYSRWAITHPSHTRGMRTSDMPGCSRINLAIHDAITFVVEQASFTPRRRDSPISRPSRSKNSVASHSTDSGLSFALETETNPPRLPSLRPKTATSLETATSIPLFFAPLETKRAARAGSPTHFRVFMSQLTSLYSSG